MNKLVVPVKHNSARNAYGIIEGLRWDTFLSQVNFVNNPLDHKYIW